MNTALSTRAVVLQAPQMLELCDLRLDEPGSDDLVVDVSWSGVSAGTERLLWLGEMPHFPGMGYPLVPGYESVGTVVDAGVDANTRIGETVFVPGATCYGDVRGLFGGSASRVVVSAQRAPKIDRGLTDQGVLLALAATAYHAIAQPDAILPELIVGHGVLGRLLARLTIAAGGKEPTVWETNPQRASGGVGYPVIDPQSDQRTDYRSVYDVSGDASILDMLIGRLARGGQVVLAGFYHQPIQFAFPPAFMREARLRVSAEWQPSDLADVMAMLDAGDLSLDGLITHRVAASQAGDAYRTAFVDPDCLKMVLDWRAAA